MTDANNLSAWIKRRRKSLTPSQADYICREVEALQAENAALREVTVKPLVWDTIGAHTHAFVLDMDTPMYQITAISKNAFSLISFIGDQGVRGTFKALDGAKAAAQSHYEDLIKPTLQSPNTGGE